MSPPYCPQLNGTAERVNKTLTNRIIAFLIYSELLMTMWELAVEAAVHVQNRTPHSSIDFNRPLKVFAPNVNQHLEKIRRFGCLA